MQLIYTPISDGEWFSFTDAIKEIVSYSLSDVALTVEQNAMVVDCEILSFYIDRDWFRDFEILGDRNFSVRFTHGNWMRLYADESFRITLNDTKYKYDCEIVENYVREDIGLFNKDILISDESLTNTVSDIMFTFIKFHREFNKQSLYGNS